MYCWRPLGGLAKAVPFEDDPWTRRAFQGLRRAGRERFVIFDVQPHRNEGDSRRRGYERYEPLTRRRWQWLRRESSTHNGCLRARTK